MERAVSRLSEQERKRDTREKIALGGLVRKAGLVIEPTNVLLGLLIEARERLGGHDGEALRQKWAEKGKAAFKGDP